MKFPQQLSLGVSLNDDATFENFYAPDLARNALVVDGLKRQVEGKGEHFSVVDPPNWPIDPVYPNPRHLVGVGLVGGLAAGIGLIVILEMMAGHINGQAAVERITGVRPLVVVPVLRADGNGILAWLQRLRSAGMSGRGA